MRHALLRGVGREFVASFSRPLQAGCEFPGLGQRRIIGDGKPDQNSMYPPLMAGVRSAVGGPSRFAQTVDEPLPVFGDVNVVGSYLTEISGSQLGKSTPTAAEIEIFVLHQYIGVH